MIQLKNKLQLVYMQSNPDRWIKFDRYPRNFVKKLFSKTSPQNGMNRRFHLMIKGLNDLNVNFDFNNFKFLKKNPTHPVCIVGQEYGLTAYDWKNPILYGPCLFSHPTDFPNIFENYPIEKLVVAGPWLQQMFQEFYGEDKVEVSYIGIETDIWVEKEENASEFDLLIYDKLYWEDRNDPNSTVQRIIEYCKINNISYKHLIYGQYSSEDYFNILGKSRGMVFLSSSETQGIAYQEALSRNVPIFAYDRQSYWEHPKYYPNVKFQPVSSVPYWDDRCGLKFKNFDEFKSSVSEFLKMAGGNKFEPRQFILDNLTLKKAMNNYLKIIKDCGF